MADGCDVVPGICESVRRLQWSGDVDLNDGTLQIKYSNYRERLRIISVMRCIQSARTFFPRVISQLNEDFKFLQKGKTLSML